jgi:hypothetical protein
MCIWLDVQSNIRVYITKMYGTMNIKKRISKIYYYYYYF